MHNSPTALSPPTFQTDEISTRVLPGAPVAQTGAVTEGVASVVVVSGVLLWLAVSLLPAVVGAAESLVLVLALALGDLLD
jgi:hypothetical protein